MRYPLSYEHFSEMLAERGLFVDASCIWRWVQAYAPELDKRCRPHLKSTNKSYRIDETYIKVKGKDRYLYRAVDFTGQTIDFLLLWSEKNHPEPMRLRRIEVWVEDKQDTLVFVTNHPRLAAATIAAVYRDRWQIELFFKAIKQSLRIKTFIGTSENAVHIQIWTALIAMLLVRYLQLRSSWQWSLSNLFALLRQQLFVYRDLWGWAPDGVLDSRQHK